MGNWTLGSTWHGMAADSKNTHCHFALLNVPFHLFPLVSTCFHSPDGRATDGQRTGQAFDTDSALRPTTIKADWDGVKKRSQEGLLSKPADVYFDKDQEKDRYVNQYKP